MWLTSSLTRRTKLTLLVLFITTLVILLYLWWNQSQYQDVKIITSAYTHYQVGKVSNEVAMTKNKNRKIALHEKCQLYRKVLPHLADNEKEYSNVIVDMQHRIMYCPIPKAACSTWKVFFMNLLGVSVRGDIHTQAKIRLVHLSDLDPEVRQEVLRNFTKFMIVRHPFTRILSAYRNKLEPNGTFETTHVRGPNQYYWRDRLGMEILKIYRGVKVAKRFKEHRGDYDLTFAEFVNFITDYSERRSANDRHWKEMYSICYPCDIEYDFIAKFETLGEDSQLFLWSNGLDTHVTTQDQHATNSSSFEAVMQFYQKLPLESIQKLYERYKLDFQLFDYDPRSFQ